MTRPEIRIPFNRALIGDHELNMLRDAASSGQICGDGPFTARCEKLLQDITGSHRALLTTSCTHALEMCAMLLKIKPGDEVIVPSFTFVSTANAFALHGAKPVFADVCPDTLNIDPEHVLRLISKRTKAIVAVQEEAHLLAARFSLAESAALIRQSVCVIGNDSAPIHIAAALDVPTVSLWGPTFPETWAPRGPAHQTVKAVEPCAGCFYWHFNASCRCHPGCIESGRYEDVAEAAQRILRRQA